MKPMTYQHRTSIPGTHPSLPGHFPGHPVVPGVVILDQVLIALQQWIGEIQLEKLPNVKFLEPIYPDDEFIISLETVDNLKFRFLCLADDRTKVSGQLSITQEPSK